MLLIENKDKFKNSVEEIRSLPCLLKVMKSYGINLNKDNTGYYTNCMFHNDKNPSMRIGNKDNRAIYYCFGCGAKGDIINFISHMESTDSVASLKKAYDILGIENKYSLARDKQNKINNFKNFIKLKVPTISKNKEDYNIEDVYIYTDENEKGLYCKTKYKSQNNQKYFITKSLIETEIGYKYGEVNDFEQSRKVLYNLPSIKNNIAKDEWIFFVEGEKDVQTLKELGFESTTIYTKKWYDSYFETLENSKVIFIGDSGRAGREFEDFVVNNLKKCCKSLKILRLPQINDIGNGKNKDITDWIESGKTKEDLIKVIKRTRNILDKSSFQQDEKGIYKINKTKEDEKNKEYKHYYTNFRIIDIQLDRKANKEQIIEFNIISSDNVSEIIQMDARQCFCDIKYLRSCLGIDFIFFGDTQDLVKFHEWILKYFILN